MSTKNKQKKIESGVGRDARNRKSDVRFVRDRLMEYIRSGSLSHLSPLPEDVKGNDGAFIHAIEQFQSRVVAVTVTGKIKGPRDQTFHALCRSPKDSSEYVDVPWMVDHYLSKGPRFGISSALWNAALESLLTHLRHPRLKKYHILSLIDFTISKREPRLWILDLNEDTQLIHTRVSHGSGNKDEDGDGKKDGAMTDLPLFLNRGAYVSKTGAFITKNRGRTTAGQKNRKSGVTGPAVWLEGVDTNTRDAARRGIIFHGAWYVTNAKAGCSRGCFATKWTDNERIVDWVKGGSFVYSWAGEKHKPKD